MMAVEESVIAVAAGQQDYLVAVDFDSYIEFEVDVVVGWLQMMFDLLEIFVIFKTH